MKDHTEYIKSLPEEKILLLKICVEVYGGDLEHFRRDLRGTKLDKPYITKTVFRIERALIGLKELQQYERDHKVLLAKLWEQLTGMIERGDIGNFWFKNWIRGGNSQLSNAGYVMTEEEQDSFIEEWKDCERWACDGCHIIVHVPKGRVFLCRKHGRGEDVIVEVKYVEYNRRPNQYTFKRFYVSVSTLMPLLKHLKTQEAKRWRFPAILLYDKH